MVDACRPEVSIRMIKSIPYNASPRKLVGGGGMKKITRWFFSRERWRGWWTPYTSPKAALAPRVRYNSKVGWRPFHSRFSCIYCNPRYAVVLSLSGAEVLPMAVTLFPWVPRYVRASRSPPLVLYSAVTLLRDSTLIFLV